MSSNGPVVLAILDGWGFREGCDNNAPCQANTPVLDRLQENAPGTFLQASGEDVGLPAGQMGNSEVGHLNLGAGRIIYQDLTRISKAVSDDTFNHNPELLTIIDRVWAAEGTLHLMGLLSDGGIHSHQEHLYALVRLAKAQGLKKIAIHAFMDGRDTPPNSGAGYIDQLEEQLKEIGCGAIASVTGRYFAMDRDRRWDRVERAYNAIVCGEGAPAASAAEAMSQAYADGETDEFVQPRVILADGAPVAPIQDGDGVLFFNFRADRVRELTTAITDAGFDGFDRKRVPQLTEFTCLTQYDETFPHPVAFPPERYSQILGEVVSRAGKKQLRIAETEKYAHVTFFFNGGEEEPFEGEDRALIPSPRDVATYDLKPEMSIYQVTEEFEKRIASGDYDLVILNFANPDMVGHTGKLDAAIQAMEAVDSCTGRAIEAVHKAGGRLLITADHGNCEQMLDDKGTPHTAHTSNPVRIYLSDPDRTDAPLRPGRLADVAPTLLELMGVEVPSEMTGQSLLA